MALTLAEYKNIARHAMSGGDPAPVVPATATADATLAFIVNQAGRAVASMHRWASLVRPPASLATVAGQDYLAMPADFGSIVAVGPGSLRRPLWLTTIDYVVQLRQNGQSESTAFWGALVQPGQASANQAPPAARLALYPTPSTTAADAFTLTYRAGWTALSADTDVANLPEFFEPLLVEMVAAFAKGREEMDPAVRQATIAAVRAGPVFAAVVAEDGSRQAHYGPMRGGAASLGATLNRPWEIGAAVQDPS